MKYFLIHDEITLADDILPREPAVCGTWGQAAGGQSNAEDDLWLDQVVPDPPVVVLDNAQDLTSSKQVIATVPASYQLQSGWWQVIEKDHLDLRSN